MITKLDKVVVAYLRALGATQPARHDEAAWAAYLDGLDRARFRVLDTLIRKPRYARHAGLSSHGRAIWRNKANPHRPPLA
jgi:hypothetical protein